MNISSLKNRFFVLPQLSTTSSTGMQTVLTYIRDNYPHANHYSWFVGTFNQSGIGWYFLMVYDTTDLYTDGLPCYAWGMAGMTNTYKAISRHKDIGQMIWY